MANAKNVTAAKPKVGGAVHRAPLGTPLPKMCIRDRGYAVLERNADNGTPTLEAYFTAGSTWYYPKGEKPYLVTNPAPAPLLVPICYRPDAARPFGHSRISRACMGLQQGALRTLKRSEISAEFYSFPQKYVLGTRCV